jgi:hypothetical protein
MEKVGVYRVVIMRNKTPRSVKPPQYTIHLSLSQELGKSLERVARRDDRSVSSLVRILLQEALRKSEQKQK